MENRFVNPHEWLRFATWAAVCWIVLFWKLGAPALMVGFALPGANMHAPDEWFPVDNFEKGIGALIRLYRELGKS